jgi:DNA-binding PadR family transcriptional regulator
MDMAELDDRDHEVLAVLVEGRVNPYYLREQTTLEKGDVTTVLNRLGRGGYIVQVTRGLYEITDKGRDEVADMEEEQ